MFQWLEKYGVRPVEGQNGSFDGRETKLENCTCSATKSIFLDNGEVCEEQSAALHAEFHGFESAEDFNKAMEETSMGFPMVSGTDTPPVTSDAGD